MRELLGYLAANLATFLDQAVGPFDLALCGHHFPVQQLKVDTHLFVRIVREYRTRESYARSVSGARDPTAMEESQRRLIGAFRIQIVREPTKKSAAARICGRGASLPERNLRQVDNLTRLRSGNNSLKVCVFSAFAGASLTFNFALDATLLLLLLLLSARTFSLAFMHTVCLRV